MLLFLLGRRVFLTPLNLEAGPNADVLVQVRRQHEEDGTAEFLQRAGHKRVVSKDDGITTRRMRVRRFPPAAMTDLNDDYNLLKLEGNPLRPGADRSAYGLYVDSDES